MRMKEYPITCPCCGNTIYISVTKTGDFYLRSFDIQHDSETIEFVKDSGYEFGATNERRCEGG